MAEALVRTPMTSPGSQHYESTRLTVDLISSSQELEGGNSSDGHSVKSPAVRTARQASLKEAGRRTARFARAGRSADWTRQRNQKQQDKARGKGRDYKAAELGKIPESPTQVPDPIATYPTNGSSNYSTPSTSKTVSPEGKQPRRRRFKKNKAARVSWTSEPDMEKVSEANGISPLAPACGSSPPPPQRAASMYPVMHGTAAGQDADYKASHKASSSGMRSERRAASCPSLEGMLSNQFLETAYSSSLVAHSAEVVVLRDNLLKLLQKALESNLNKLVQKASDLEGRLEEQSLQQLSSHADAELRLEKMAELTQQAQSILKRRTGRCEAETMLLPKLVESMSVFCKEVVELVFRQQHQHNLDSHGNLVTDALKQAAELYRWIHKHFDVHSEWVEQLNDAATMLMSAMIVLTEQHQKQAMDCWNQLQCTPSNMAQLPAEVQRAWKTCISMQSYVLSAWPKTSQVHRQGLIKLCNMLVNAANTACSLLGQQEQMLKAAPGVGELERKADGMYRAMTLIQNLHCFSRTTHEMLNASRSDDLEWAEEKRICVNRMREAFFRVVFAVTDCSCGMYPANLNLLHDLQLNKLQSQASRALTFVMEWDLCRELNLGYAATDMPAEQTLFKLTQLMEVTTKLLNRYEDARKLLDERAEEARGRRILPPSSSSTKPLFAQLRERILPASQAPPNPFQAYLHQLVQAAPPPTPGLFPSYEDPRLGVTPLAMQTPLLVASRDMLNCMNLPQSQPAQTAAASSFAVKMSEKDAAVVGLFDAADDTAAQPDVCAANQFGIIAGQAALPHGGHGAAATWGRMEGVAEWERHMGSPGPGTAPPGHVLGSGSSVAGPSQVPSQPGLLSSGTEQCGKLFASNPEPRLHNTGQSQALNDPFWTVSWDEVMRGAEQLESGSFGKVYRARYCHAEVAVKVLTVAPSDLDRVTQEVDILRNLARHPHIVRFLGACKRHGIATRGSGSDAEQDQLAIVMEYCDLGSLFNVINNKHKRMSNERLKQFFNDYWLRLEVARGVAAGLAYMHRQNPKVVHRDLTSYNVLLQYGHPWVAKVSDFGMSRVKDADRSALYASGEICSPAWRAPELLKEGAKYTEKADVYSFGVILWEIIMLRQPWQQEVEEEWDSSDESGHRLHKDFEKRLYIRGQVCEGHTLDFEQAREKLQGKGLERGVVLSVERLAHKCWQMDPTKRPDMDYVAAELADIISKYVRLTRRTDVPHSAPVPRPTQYNLSIANYLRG